MRNKEREQDFISHMRYDAEEALQWLHTVKYIGKRRISAVLGCKPSGLYDRTQAHLLWFGRCSPIYVLVYSHTLEDALEDAAQWLADSKLWGLITPHSEPQSALCCDCTDPLECDSHTYTESGWLASEEWGIVGSPITRSELIAFHHAR